MIYPYKINTREDLLRLSELACEEDFPIYINTTHGQLDARSLLGLFSILGKEINLAAPDHCNADDFAKFIEKLETIEN